MKRIGLSPRDRSAISKAREIASQWCREHPQLLVGVAEMALGAALLSWGVQAGTIEMGAQIVGTMTDITSTGGVAGAVTGLVVGGIAAKIVGSIGIVGMGSAVGVPVGVLALGAGGLLSALGYTVGDVVDGYLSRVDMGQLAVGAGALGVGLALLVDGARRVAREEAVSQGAARVTATAVELFDASATVVARTVADLQRYRHDAAALGVSSLAGMGGAAFGGAYAASTVTVLGSKTIGALVLATGLVSTPVWPVLLGGSAAAVGAGLLARRVFRARKS